MPHHVACLVPGHRAEPLSMLGSPDGGLLHGRFLLSLMVRGWGGEGHKKGEGKAHVLRSATCFCYVRIEMGVSAYDALSDQVPVKCTHQ